MNTTTLINFLRNREHEVKQVWLADDAAAGGRLEGLFNWYEALIMEGKKYGYYVNKKKCWLIVKSEELAKEAQNMVWRECKHHNCREETLGSSNWIRRIQG